MSSLHRPTFDEIRAAFGDFTPHLLDDGTVGPGWEREIISYAALPAPLPLSWMPEVKVSRLKAHRRIVWHLEEVLAAIFNVPEAWASINDTGGAYAFRPNRMNPKAPSLHCWGIAIDLDVRDNPQRRMSAAVHPKTLEIMERHGWYWGGYFKGRSVDAMHWECSRELIERLG